MKGFKRNTKKSYGSFFLSHQAMNIMEEERNLMPDNDETWTAHNKIALLFEQTILWVRRE